MTYEDIELSLSVFLLSASSLFFSILSLKSHRIVVDTPTSKTTGIFIGTVELEGNAQADELLTSHLAGVPCVYFEWTVEEHYERDSVALAHSLMSKDLQTTTERGWKVVASGSSSTPFFLKDDYGTILVRPQGAAVDGEVVVEKTVNSFDPLYFNKGPEHEIEDSTKTRRFTEVVIKPGADVYVIGQARERSDLVAAEIAASPKASLFLISTRKQAALGNLLSRTILVRFLIGLLLAYVFALTLPGISLDSPWYIQGIIPFGFVILWMVAWTIVVFNSLAGLRRRVDQASSNVDVMLKRRNDLIPSLVKVVEAAAAHESVIQKHLAHLRSLADHPGEYGHAALVALAEAYPDLKADAAFLDLQKELTSTETRIALARAYYLDVASFFETRSEVIPDRWLCLALPDAPSAKWRG